MTRDLNDEEMEIFREEKFNRQVQARLVAHPDCRDPDHPGCAKCDPELWNPDND